jgi:hypothetical protein
MHSVALAGADYTATRTVGVIQQQQAIRFPRLRMPNAQPMEGMREVGSVREGTYPAHTITKLPSTCRPPAVKTRQLNEWVRAYENCHAKNCGLLQGLGVGGLCGNIVSFKADLGCFARVRSRSDFLGHTN